MVSSRPGSICIGSSSTKRPPYCVLVRLSLTIRCGCSPLGIRAEPERFRSASWQVACRAALASATHFVSDALVAAVSTRATLLTILRRLAAELAAVAWRVRESRCQLNHSGHRFPAVRVRRPALYVTGVRGPTFPSGPAWFSGQRAPFTECRNAATEPRLPCTQVSPRVCVFGCHLRTCANKLRPRALPAGYIYLY